jgi:hypothetical protein
MDDEKLQREAVKMLFAAPAKPEEAVARVEPDGPEIPFVCPFCNEEYQVSKELAGKKINCRNCREPCRVDGKRKVVRRVKKRRPFWLGVIVGLVFGVVITAAAVVLLKIAGLL